MQMPIRPAAALALITLGFGQSPSGQDTPPPVQEEPRYERDGAENGKVPGVEAPVRQDAPSFTDADLQEIQRGHMANIRRMADSGDLVIAGPMEEDGALRGIFVFRTPSQERIRDLVAQDPALQTRRLEMQLYTWIVPRAVLRGAITEGRGDQVGVRVRSAGEVVIIELEGEIAIGGGVVAKSVDLKGRRLEDVRDALLDTLGRGHSRIVLDLRGVSFMDSAGLGELVACKKRALEHGGDVKLLRPAGRVKELLSMLQLSRIFEIYQDEGKAVGSFG